MSDYAISLSDVRGVGPETLAVLEDEGVTCLEDLRKVAQKGSLTWRALDESQTVPRSTLNHLSAVGQAVRGTPPLTVQAKHLTGFLAEQAEFAGSYVRLDQTRSTTDGASDASTGEAGQATLSIAVDQQAEDDEPDVPAVDDDTLGAALSAIHEAYNGTGQAAQNEFHSGITDYARAHGSEAKFNHPRLLFALIRYRFNASDVRQCPDTSDEHLALLVGFAGDELSADVDAPDLSAV